MTGLGYTLPALASVPAVVTAELRWLRTGLFRQPAYWITMAITLAFQVLVDGWLTKLSAPIVIYRARDLSGLRVPFDIPVEDYLFGVSLVTVVLLCWVRLGRREATEG